VAPVHDRGQDEEVPSSAERADALAHRIQALGDMHMRIARVRQALGAMDPATAADVITVVSARAQAREGPHASLLLAISLALSTPEAAELRRAVGAAAAARDQTDVAALLGARSRADDDRNEDQHPVPDLGLGRPPTLGERKAVARRTDRDLIARVLRDPHPDVIRNLLRNPALTEDDVVRLCARRPVPPEVLREVFGTPRWIARYRVQRALVRNPYAPREIALQLVPHLHAQDARAASQATDLHDEVRLACRRAGGARQLH
jgi:hypothetical protein